MQIFARAMYEVWCAGLVESEIKDQHKAFILIASKHLSREVSEMEHFLFSQSWFLRP